MAQSRGLWCTTCSFLVLKLVQDIRILHRCRDLAERRQPRHPPAAAASRAQHVWPYCCGNAVGYLVHALELNATASNGLRQTRTHLESLVPQPFSVVHLQPIPLAAHTCAVESHIQSIGTRRQVCCFVYAPYTSLLMLLLSLPCAPLQCHCEAL